MNYARKLETELKYWGFLYKSGGAARIRDYLKENVAFDMQYGTDTSGWLEPGDYEDRPENLEHGVRYRASYTSEICDALKKVGWMLPLDRASFFDLGCGKGKAVLLARKLCPFERVVGVDYYARFIDVARRNVEKMELDNIELHHGNAENFTDFSATSIVYMYNPFDDYIMRQVRQNIERNTNRCIVIYNKPVHIDVFDGWNTVERKSGWNVDWETAILSWSAEAVAANDAVSDRRLFGVQ